MMRCSNFKQKIEREEIDRICKQLESLPNKTPDNHSVDLLRIQREPNQGQGTKKFTIFDLRLQSGAKNALSGKMISQLTKQLDEIELWLESQDENSILDRCGLVVRGLNGTFCSGLDLVTVAACTANQQAGLELALVMQYNCVRIERLPMISVAFVEGYALGGGAELALATDFRIMSPEAKLGFVHALNGICCGFGGAARLNETLGRSRALELLSSGRLVDVREAEQLGLAERLSQPATLNGAHEFLISHSLGSTRTVHAIKTTLERHCSAELERACFASTWGGRLHLNALEANKRHGRSSGATPKLAKSSSD